MSLRRPCELKFRVSESERDTIIRKMQSLGITNREAYLRKMACDGYCVRLDLPELRRLVYLINRTSNNLNQYAKKANTTGSIYAQDIEDLQKAFSIPQRRDPRSRERTSLPGLYTGGTHHCTSRRPVRQHHRLYLLNENGNQQRKSAACRK